METRKTMVWPTPPQMALSLSLQALSLVACLRNDQDVEFHLPSRAYPGWKTASAPVANMIIGASRAMNAGALFANALPNPECSSISLYTERKNINKADEYKAEMNSVSLYSCGGGK